MAYSYKPAEAGIVGKLNAIADYNAAFPVALNYMTQGALSPDGFSLWNSERTSKIGGGNGKLTPKVSRKGGVSVYGLGQWPVTLYAEQWERLLAGAPADHFVLAFIASNPTTNWPATDKEPACAATIVRKGAKQAA